jgi:hypothetical protein
MSNTDASERSEAARAAARARRGSQVVTRAAAIVVERVDELPDAERAVVHRATGTGDTND